MSSPKSGTRPDFETEGLLEGLDREAREGRLRLLEHLFDAGIGLEELREAAENDRMAILPAEHELGGESRFSAQEISEKSGVPLEYFLATRRARAWPQKAPTNASTQMTISRPHGSSPSSMRSDREAMLEVARVLGRGLAQTADAIGAVFQETFIKAGVTEEELGLRNAQAAREWLPRLTPLLEYVLKQHMRERLRHQAVSQAMLETREVPGASDVAVAFADMVAFTRLGERLRPEEVGGIAGRLGELATVCVDPPVRLVKMIGDAAMLVAPDAESLVHATLALIDRAEQLDDFPQLRAGAAYGAALNRSGDWYGHVVNLASRITGLAEPGSLVATKELRDGAGELCTWVSQGAHPLKGVDGKVEIYRAERAGETSRAPSRSPLRAL